ncbi:MAG: hypothetical protein VKJ46_09770 [Leptolyngbyaceae bacterium]|nr:hypothetical protein [Leptolyngbyaceae bacterium]
MEKPFQLAFANGQMAHAIQVRTLEDLPEALQSLGLDQPRPALVVVGGASGMTSESLARLHLLFVEVLAPLAEALGLVVIDGGTDAGVMRLMGQACAELMAQFPRIGVAAIETVSIPSCILAPAELEALNLPTPIADAAPLEPNHTHFVLVPGSAWGDESPWLAQIASVLTAGLPSVTILINGGAIAWSDVRYSVTEGRTVMVMDGSGRTADTLAAGLRGEIVHEQAQALGKSGLLEVIDLRSGFDTLSKVIEGMFSTKE